MTHGASWVASRSTTPRSTPGARSQPSVRPEVLVNDTRTLAAASARDWASPGVKAHSTPRRAEIWPTAAGTGSRPESIAATGSVGAASGGPSVSAGAEGAGGDGRGAGGVADSIGVV